MGVFLGLLLSDWGIALVPEGGSAGDLQLAPFNKVDCLDQLRVCEVWILTELESNRVPGLDVLIVLNRQLRAVLEDLQVLNIEGGSNSRVMLEGRAPKERVLGKMPIPLSIKRPPFLAVLLLNGENLIREFVVELRRIA